MVEHACSQKRPHVSSCGKIMQAVRPPLLQQGISPARALGTVTGGVTKILLTSYRNQLLEVAEEPTVAEFEGAVHITDCFVLQSYLSYRLTRKINLTLTRDYDIAS